MHPSSTERSAHRPRAGGRAPFKRPSWRFGLAAVGLAWGLSQGLTQGAASGVWQEGPGHRFRTVQPGEGAGREPGTRSVGFTIVPPRSTGVHFGNRLRVELMMLNNNFMNGSGVAAGDFDGDGWCDLFFAAIDGTNALYRNLGGWRFEEVTAAAGVGMPGAHATGAAFADLDGDGDLDLLVATLGRGVHGFENLGGGRFREITGQLGVARDTGSTSLALADVDGDGDLDLYVANYGAYSILRSGGRAELRQVDGRWVVVGPYAGRLRLVDGRLEEVGEPDRLYLNDGRGRFTPVPWNSEFFLDEQGRPREEPWDFGLSVQMRDLNGDGAPDIYVCNDFQTVDRIWLNDGTGRFRALPRLAMRKQSFSSMGVDFADIDRDGFPDFLATEMMSRDHRLRMRQTVGVPPLIPEPGRIDNRPMVARNTLFWNRGDDTFTEVAHYAGVVASDWSWQPVFLDVDLDGFEDLLIGNGMPFDVQDRDVLNAIRSLGRQSPEQSRTNLALYPPFITRDQALRNRGNLTFEDVSDAWGFAEPRITQGMVMADLDNDGDLDLVFNGVNSGAALWRNEARQPRLAVRLRGRAPNTAGVGAQIRVQDGAVPLQTQEIVCGGHYLSGSDPLRVFAAGTRTNRLTLEVRWRSGIVTVLPDVRPDHVYEIEEPSTGDRPEPPARRPEPVFDEVTRWLNHEHREEFFADYAFQPLLPRQLSQPGPGLGWIDLDGDGVDELVIGAGRGGSPAVFRWHAPDRFERVPAARGWVAPDDLTGVAGWVDGQGTRSVLMGLAHVESRAPWPMGVIEGRLVAGELAVRPLNPVRGTRTSAGPLAVTDLDGDGRLDLFVGGRVIPGAYPEAGDSRLFRQGSAGLVPDEEATRQMAGLGLVSGAVWSDLNGDGHPELILALEWGAIRVWRNHQGRLEPWDPELRWPAGESPDPAARTLSTLTGWWNSVTTGDFDGDGRLDLVAGNWGLNTPWQPDFTHPIRLYYGDLLGSGTVDLIEAAHVPELGAEAPQRSLNALAQAFPMLMARYPSHQAFGEATLPEILALLPEPARAVSANTLASFVFLNRGDHFIPVPLPKEAQLSPAFSLNVADFNGDGHEDLFLSQNFFALRPEVPRLDGGRGLWLRGDGTGRFTAVPAHESGVRVHGEQRGAALGDFDGDGRMDLVVSQNGAATVLYRNRSGQRGLRVRLEGPAGNPDGVGAVIRLGNAHGFGPAREVKAGAGYWSQDSATQVLAREPAPDRISVRWPGGRETLSPIPPGTGTLRVRTDGRTAFSSENAPSGGRTP